MLTIEHSGDHLRFNLLQPWRLLDQGHRIAKDKLSRVIPPTKINRISGRAKLRISVCSFTEGLQRTCIRMET